MTQSSCGENRGLVKTGLGLWCHIAYSQGSDATDYRAVILVAQLRSPLKRQANAPHRLTMHEGEL